MNFLAHLYFSQKPPELMVGNFIGDFVKGKQYKKYPESIQKGIILHREIDAFTDDNEWVRKSKKRLVPKYNHYAAVIVDMFYDHFLASQWQKYHHQTLKEFSTASYAILQHFAYLLPEKARYVLPHMAKHNWLLSYAKISGIDRALTGLSRRTHFISHMEHASNDLKAGYEEYRNEFNAFFPIINKYITEWRAENKI